MEELILSIIENTWCS